MFLEINIDDEIKPIEFNARLINEESNIRRWELRSMDDAVDVRIEFQEREFVLLKITTFPEEVRTEKIDVETLINDFLKEELENRQSGFDDSDDNEPEDPQPYDPHKINIRNDRWSISHMFELIDKWKQVDLSPDFQRGFVWDYKRRSQLIESLMLRIPVPAFYLSETIEGRYQVVDGLQRLTTITQFLQNEFPLKHLEYLKDQETRYFTSEGKKVGIESNYWRNILQTQITVNIIESTSPAKVKFDVFRRVNTGGKPLNNQEIRNCLSNENTRMLINGLAFSEEFRDATWRSVSTSRMQAQELILRFIVFWHEKIKRRSEWEYKGNMTEYLDSSIELINERKALDNNEIIDAFKKGMRNSFHLFGPYSFRKCLPEHLKPGARQQLINKSLFTTWSVMLSDVDTEVLQKAIKEGEYIKTLADCLKSDQKYYEAVSYKTNDKIYVELAFAKAKELISNLTK